MQLIEQIQQLDFPAPLPETLLAVEQHFDAPKVEDLTAATRAALEDSGLLGMMNEGDSVALGVGSRGIANLAHVVRAAVDRLKDAGMKPFIMPAMGSHGGATVEGQREVLANLGVTEESAGTEIRATMEVTEIGQIENGPVLYQGVDSIAADHAILVSRIKPHTDFRSHVESGPAKMSVIGLGKQFGAAIMHRGGGANFEKYLTPAARVYETNTNLIGALGLVENAYDETAIITGLTAADIGAEREVELQQTAKDLMACIHFPEIDILTIQQIGKDISGAGMDPNVTGRLMIPRQPEHFKGPDLAIITVLDLTEATHGNACGIGLANITTARVVEQIDWQVTYTNGITSGIFGAWRNSIPMTLPDDRSALQASIRVCAEPYETARMAFIQDTLNIGQMWISPSLRGVAESLEKVEIVGEVPLTFDDMGNMVSPWALGK